MDIKELRVSNADKTKNHPWEHARSKVIYNIINKHIEKEDKEKLILDIGCGDAFFLTSISSKFNDYKLVAVDTAFNEELLNTLSEKYKEYDILFKKNITEVSNNQKASMIFLLDVIEHIEEDVAFLKEILNSDFVTSNTVFVITVPAFNSLYCLHDDFLGHQRRYSQKLLKSTIKQSGLTYITGGYFFTSLLIPRFLQKTIEKIIKKDSKNIKGIGNWTGGKAISWIYEKTLLLDYYFSKVFKIFGIKVPGLSTYVICKKNTDL